MSFGDQRGLEIGDTVIVNTGHRACSPQRRRIDGEPARVDLWCGPADAHGCARAVISTCGMQPVIPACELTKEVA